MKVRFGAPNPAEACFLGIVSCGEELAGQYPLFLSKQVVSSSLRLVTVHRPVGRVGGVVVVQER